VRLVIVGNSAAALSALESFRKRDPGATVTIVTDEGARPYSRVLLTYYLRRKLAYDALFIRGPEYYAGMGAEVVSGVRVEHVDAPAHRLELADGRRLDYDRLLLATGSRPATPPIPGLAGPAVCHLWSLDDAMRLDPLLRVGARMLVLGSGFIALQAAWTASQRGMAVTVIELEDRIMPTVLDPAAARMLHEQMLAHGVAVHTGTRAEGLESDASGLLHVFAVGTDPFAVDAVIVGTGALPNDELLPQTMEPGKPGIPVSATMETSVPGVFAAGDVTRGPTAAGGPREIHALWPTAVEQGKVAGANLAGAGVMYGGSLSMNVTEMFGWTVASLGRFVEAEGEDVLVHRDLADIVYLKLVVRAGVPVGAVAMGGPEAAGLLGRLRPYVRHRKTVADLRSLLDGGDLAQRLDPRRAAIAARA
jgi:NADPH-dependent 2,4-dienoyl-CoA reductase/sulfur reductase-like enzyme